MFGHTYPQNAWSYSNIEFAIPVNDMRQFVINLDVKRTGNAFM